jgi:hypothetical protein
MSNGHGGARPGSGRPRKTLPPANRETLTEDQIATLKASKHIADIKGQQVSYTLAYKEMFWQRYLDGVPPGIIFREAGLDPDVLGANRLNGFVETLRKQNEAGIPFTEGHQWSRKPEEPKRFDIPKPPRKPPGTKGRACYSSEDIDRLFHQVAYMSQEMEFLKKIIISDNGRKSE